MKNVVLCGSIKFIEKIKELANVLKEKGYNVLLPVEYEGKIDRVVTTRNHLEKIIHPDNEIILIVNETKNGIENYIGPNSFVEVAFGFYYKKRIYLLNDIYPPYKDELLGWKVVPLKGDLSKIK